MNLRRWIPGLVALGAVALVVVGCGKPGEKVTVLAQGWPIDTTGGPHFTDVPTTHPFYGYIETAYNHQIISGYQDGTFRPDNNATRGQISVIVYQATTNP